MILRYIGLKKISSMIKHREGGERREERGGRRGERERRRGERGGGISFLFLHLFFSSFFLFLNS